jgi:hypothetical protein
MISPGSAATLPCRSDWIEICITFSPPILTSQTLQTLERSSDEFAVPMTHAHQYFLNFRCTLIRPLLISRKHSSVNALIFFVSFNTEPLLLDFVASLHKYTQLVMTSVILGSLKGSLFGFGKLSPVRSIESAVITLRFDRPVYDISRTDLELNKLSKSKEY